VSASTLPSPGERRLRVAAEYDNRDLNAAEAAARAFLVALGADVDHEAAAETPARMTKAYAELLSPREFDLTTFPNDEGYEELVLVQSIPFSALCEHHALLFIGYADVGYLPDKRIIGLSKLARVVELFAHQSLQVQERLTKQIADWLTQHLAAKGIGVVLRAQHLCMTLRGVQASGATSVTSSLHGLLLDDPAFRHEFFTLTQLTR
jgi:GTP cyclohydrolase I